MYSVKHKIILLNNRKCGSTSLSKFFFKNIRDAKKIDDNGEKFSDIFQKNSYNCHINASKCIKYFKNKNINISDYDIITTIRDPIYKAISSYKYYKPDNNLLLSSNFGYNKKKNSIVILINIS